jgi:hypothetical protein
MTLLLSIDPSLRASAWIRNRIVDGEPVDAGAIESVSAFADDAGDVWALDELLDDARCATTSMEAIASLVVDPRVAAVALEAGPLGAKNPRALSTMVRANQAVICGAKMGNALREREGLPRVEIALIAAAAAKQAATGARRPKNGKADVRVGVEHRYGVERMAHLASCARTTRGREGVYDAAAVAMRALRLGVIRAHITAPAAPASPEPRMYRPRLGTILDPVTEGDALGAIDGSVQLSNKACPDYYGGTRATRCGCPEGRCWYDEQLARRKDLRPALTPEAWMRAIAPRTTNTPASVGGED